MDSFQTKDKLNIQGSEYEFFNLNKLEDKYKVSKLPFSLRILLENLLRTEDGESVTEDSINALLNWDPKAKPSQEIAFTPSRVILQDFTGVPAVADLAAMRDAMKELGGDPNKINPLSPVELVIDHSVMVDNYGTKDSLDLNTAVEFKRNSERYAFLRWGQEAFSNFKVVPPGTGIVHQVNLEYLARVVFEKDKQLYLDTVVGTDSHTTMINGLGVLGWGVGGIEAEAAMLGQPVTMLIPEVVGFKLTGKLPAGTTATDLVLTVVEMLRKHGVVGKFVEFYGDGLDNLHLADRATIANMAPEYGATCGIFPFDDETIEYLRLSGRSEEKIALVEQYAKAQGMYRTSSQVEAKYSSVLDLDISTIVPCIAGPKRPQDRIPLNISKSSFNDLLNNNDKDINFSTPVNYKDQNFELKNGAVVIAAITSCTNTSNPDVMLAAGLIAKKAIELGLDTKPWVKTSLAPGSQVVTEYLEKSSLLNPLADIGFNLVGYGCTTCIGNSGPLPEPINNAVAQNGMSVCAVLSGNRNFEGRIHPLVQNAYLASPPLVVAYALAGTMDIDFATDKIATVEGRDIYLKDIWPSNEEIHNLSSKIINADMFTNKYKSVFVGPKEWQKMDTPLGSLFDWSDESTYIKNPPYFLGMTKDQPPVENIKGARVLALLGDSVTTDHISPAGVISLGTPGGDYLEERKVLKPDFNSYGSRRGNPEIMTRGTFSNVRLKNLLAPGTEGGFTTLLPENKQTTIFDASIEYKKRNTPLVVIGGSEYGTGSSRDWAAKGTRLLGVRAVIVKSFERIHRSNLIGMGVLPLQFVGGQSANSLGLTGHEIFDIDLSNLSPQGTIKVVANQDGKNIEFDTKVRIDTPKELTYYQNGGILHYVLRQLA